MNRIVPLVSLLLIANVLAGCDGKPAANSGPPPPTVTVAHPLQKSITEWDEYTGRFTPLETVEVRARVSGFIDSVHFQEGQIVKKDDLLFVIDQRPYQIAVEQAKADIQRAQAKLDIATEDVNRATPLLQSQTLTEREFDTRKSVQRDAAGQLASANAALKQAELNLEWTEVRAPIAGRISDKRVDAGNLITGGQTGATLLERHRVDRSHPLRVRRQRDGLLALSPSCRRRDATLVARRAESRGRPPRRRDRIHAYGANGLRR